MDTVSRLLIAGGAAMLVTGVLLWGLVRTGVERLPGDIYIDRGDVRLWFPLGASIVLSIVLTAVLNIVVRLFR